MEEQLIQDSISNLARLRKVLDLFQLSGWTIEQSDTLNQEFNFSVKSDGKQVGGRVDVIATFNGRTRLVLVEVKDVASETDLQQLFWYYDNCRAMNNAHNVDFQNVDFNETVGILLASSFVPGTYDFGGRRIYLVKLAFDGTDFPFKAATIDSIPSTQQASQAIVRHSRLYTMQENRDYMDSALRGAFDELCNLCLSENSPLRLWVFQNPKGDHIAVHYKGKYVIWLQVRRNWFYVGYDTPNGPVRNRVELATLDTVLRNARHDFDLLLKNIDTQDQMRGIPVGFDWGDCR